MVWRCFVYLCTIYCELNATELIWADEKNFVARENKEMTIEHVETLFRKRRAQRLAKTVLNMLVLWKKSTGKQTELWIRNWKNF